MHLTKPALLLLALTISASCVASTPQQDLLEGIWDVLGKTGQDIVSGIVEATKNGSAIAEDLVGSLQNSTSKFAEQTLEFADRIASALHAAVAQGLQEFRAALRANIEALRQGIARASSRIKRQALKDALAGLQGINASVSDLEIALQNITDQLEEKKQQYGAEVQLTWNNWAAAQLERVDNETNGVGVEEAQEILDEMENRYAGYLQSCLEEQQVRLATYEQEVHEVVARYQNATNDLVAQIEVCQQVWSGSISCRAAIKKALKALQSAPRDLLNLKLKGLRLLAINLDEAGCVGQTLAEHALERPSVERKLDEIIQRYQEQSATDSSEDGDSSDSDETTTPAA
ncbi:hypothetical protein KR054_000305, partial [Drosophila jambulina]